LGKAIISTSLEAARRLAVTKQHLAGKLAPTATTEHILSVVRDLGYVQWDPIAAIAPSHIISLWSRLGNFRLSDLDRLLWDEKKLFQHWAPIAMIVLTEDYPLYYSLMKRYPESLTKSWGGQRLRARKFLAEHGELRKRVLTQLRNGPLQLSQFNDYVKTKRNPDGWTSGSDVSQTLSHMQMSGEAMVVGHEGLQNIWGLSERFLPSWTKRTELPGEEFELQAAQRAIGALGTASPREIHYYFARGRYQNLAEAMERLEKESAIHRVSVAGLGGKDERYIHDQDMGLLESMNSDDWQPRMSLLGPFDNLIVGRDRTNRIFGFDYVHEQFLPAEKRKFGTFVLPILWGERLIGRADMLMDRKNEKLLVNSVHAQPGAPAEKKVALGIAKTMQRFAEFLEAKEVVYTARVPKAWRNSLH
jgi:uncharacterized protein YcaQ